MVLDAVANFVRGNTDAAVDSSQTTVSVTDASIFPDPATEGEYNVVIWDATNFPRPDQDGDVEILRVTAIDTGANDLTVTRAQETTTAAAHPDGSAIHLSPTAKMFSDIKSEYTASGENFDGEGTSEFINLQSVNTENLHNRQGDPRLADSTVRIYNDGSDYVAIDSDGTRISRDANCATVTQAANDSLPNPDDPQASGGGSIRFAEGTFPIESTVTLDTSVFIRGQGMRATQLRLPDDADTDMFAINRSGRVPFLGFSNIKLEGNKANNASGSAIVHQTNVTDVLLETVWIDTFAENAYRVDAPDNDVWNIWFNRVLAEGCGGVELLFDGSGEGNIYNIYVQDSYFLASGGEKTVVKTVGDVDDVYLDSPFRARSGDSVTVDVGSNTSHVWYNGSAAKLTGNLDAVWRRGVNWSYDDVIFNTSTGDPLPTSYTSVSVGGVYSGGFATGVMLQIALDGTGTAGQAFVKFREGGTSRGLDGAYTINGDETFTHFIGPVLVPLDDNDSFDVEVNGEVDDLTIKVLGIVT